MAITIPTFITKSRVVRPDLLAETPDPQTDVTHEEWNALWQLAVEAAQGVNAAASSGPQLLLDMPIATGSVAAAASWGRTDADTPVVGASPAAPPGTQLVDLVPDPTMASRECLRAGVTGGAGEGLWLYKVEDVTLPAEGFVLEVDVADLADASVTPARGVIALIYDDYDEGGARATPRGLVCTIEMGSGNVYLSAWGMGSSVYTAEDPAVTDFGGGTIHDTAAMQAGGFVYRFEVRRAASETPAEWSIRCEARDPSGTVTHSSVTGVSSPVTDLDGRLLASIGLGGHVDTSAGPAGNAWISVRRLRVWSL